MTSEIVPKTQSISVSRLKQEICYDAVTGDLSWARDGVRKKAGGKTGSLSHGYVCVHIDGVSFMAHRIAWALHYGEFPKKDLDHINGIKSDNRILNLRLASEVENGYNIPKKTTNKSGFKGVYKCHQTGKWSAECVVNKRKHWLGRFDSAKDAGVAYEEFAKKNHGAFFFSGSYGDAS